MPSLVLASASPRRRELLAELGAAFEVVPADVPERPRERETPARFARRVAREKAAAVARLRPGHWVLAADTVVAVDGRSLGKPDDIDTARCMLRTLSGRSHEVYTAVVLLSPAGARLLDAVARTEVEFRSLTEEEIRAYISTGEPADKAGAYAIQGGAAAFVKRVAGSYTNVVGLPTELISPALVRAGLLAAPDLKAGA